jgi:hypothetical protein
MGEKDYQDLFILMNLETYGLFNSKTKDSLKNTEETYLWLKLERKTIDTGNPLKTAEYPISLTVFKKCQTVKKVKATLPMAESGG